MNDPCPECGRKFDRAPGYLLGSIYFNYGVTSFLVVVAYFSLFLSKAMTGRQLLWVLATFSLLFPLWFFRYARGLWIAFDERFDPWPSEQESRELAARNSVPARTAKRARSFPPRPPTLRLPGPADREVSEAAERADDHERHRHHKQDAIEVARHECSRRGSFSDRPSLQVGQAQALVARHNMTTTANSGKNRFPVRRRKNCMARVLVLSILGYPPTGGQRW